MTAFRYEAVDRDGGTKVGQLTAVSREEAVERLIVQGLVPIRVSATGGGEANRPWFMGSASDRPTAETLVVLRNLATLMGAGLTVVQSLGVVHKLARPRYAPVIERMLVAVRAGRSLSDAMADAPALFPETLRGAVAAGEAGGRLADMLDQLVEWVERDLATQRRLISMLTYPAILLLVMTGAMTVIFGVVLPRLEPLFAGGGAQLPVATRVVLALGHLFRDWGELIGILLVVAGVGFLIALRLPAFKAGMDGLAMGQNFLFGLPRRTAAARFCHTLATLVVGGLSLDRALAAAAVAIHNGAMQARLRVAVDQVRRGGRLGPALAETGLMPPAVVELAAVGEETGRLGPMLKEAARTLDVEVGHTLDRISTLLPPAITLILGGLVAGLMAGVVGGLLAANEFAL
ncbi:type II secretion system F family protein [Oleomonas cavernae]|nr:type II secretion system F family protein [Oleomonas cavernae]